MHLVISSQEYDYHTLVKVAEMAGLAGIVGFHQAGEIISLPSPTAKTPRN